MRQYLVKRFLRYVKIDTQSQEDVEGRYPSTEKQKNLSRLLVKELRALGLKDAAMDKNGIVMATLPCNLTEAQSKKIPVIGFLGHVDTSPDVSDENVRSIVHEKYNGGDIILPGDKTQVIKVNDNPDLKHYVGKDIITSDGTTLLGADDKAGIAEIMTMVDYLRNHPDMKHGKLRIGFTPDEEVAMGTKYFDIKAFGADFAYTVDGEGVGQIENETFNAAGAVFDIKGVSMHPGYAKGKMVNALRIAADIIKALEDDPAPETTEKREGYLHPYTVNGGADHVTLKLIVRDFEKEAMMVKRDRLQEIQKQMAVKYPKAVIDLDIKDQYENMRFMLEKDPRPIEYAMEAVRRVGIEPKLHYIRGGTDGAKLSSRGLLTPNIFSGGKNFHSRLEWVAVEAMEKAVETLVHLVQIWTEGGL
ncbi:peptidase T [bacterium]|nr:peptidase T [bacterium]